MNAANQVTVARLVLTLAYFVLLAWISPLGEASPRGALDAAFVLFVVAAATDILDGWLARHYRTITSFGRIADPFADKVLVCGSLVFLTAVPPPARLLPAWMVVAVIAREFIVHGVRSQVEAQGVAFGARASGKFKMFSQSVAVGGLLLYWGALRAQAWAETTVTVLVWVALALTLASGAQYLWQARRVLRMHAPPPEPPPAPPRPGRACTF